VEKVAGSEVPYICSRQKWKTDNVAKIGGKSNAQSKVLTRAECAQRLKRLGHGYVQMGAEDTVWNRRQDARDVEPLRGRNSSPKDG
jgi:hypothetical protein